MSNAFNCISKYISSEMRMSHIYQPVMLKELLKTGKSSVNSISKAILQYDLSQIEYYEQITKLMPGKVLGDHKLVSRTKDGYSLNDYNDLRPREILDLNKLCERKLGIYIERRGTRIWEHRNRSIGYISGSKQYEVLRRAKTRCESCGVSNSERRLDVDHIIPRNQKGPDDISNLQALCYRCNAQKQDKDDTDFRAIRESYNYRDKDCVFCGTENLKTLDAEELAFVIRDKFPVTQLHTLIIPKRHIRSYFELGRPELNACNLLMEKQKKSILEKDHKVTGFNIGINEGVSAGQTVMHVHIHLIPRRKGDVDDPRGGVRKIL